MQQQDEKYALLKEYAQDYLTMTDAEVAEWNGRTVEELVRGYVDHAPTIGVGKNRRTGDGIFPLAGERHCRLPVAPPSDATGGESQEDDHRT